MIFFFWLKRRWRNQWGLALTECVHILLQSKCTRKLYVHVFWMRDDNRPTIFLKIKSRFNIQVETLILNCFTLLITRSAEARNLMIATNQKILLISSSNSFHRSSKMLVWNDNNKHTKFVQSWLMPNDRTPQTTNCSIGWFCAENGQNFFFRSLSSQQRRKKNRQVSVVIRLTSALESPGNATTEQFWMRSTLPWSNFVELRKNNIPIANSQLVQMMCFVADSQFSFCTRLTHCWAEASENIP